MVDHSYLTLVCCHCGHSITVPKYCGNRFCSTCGKSRTNRLRRRLGSVTAKITPRDPDTVKLLTLTIPRRQNLLLSVIQLQSAFRRLRQRAWWRKNVRGGAYFIEFRHTAQGWNPHLHVIVESAFLPVGTIRRHWESVSPGKIVDIRRIPLGSAVRYVTKYCTKLDLPEVLQQQASDALKSKRLFTLFGRWALVPKSGYVEGVRCTECGVAAWFFNPFGTIDEWVSRKLSPYIDLPPREPPKKPSPGEVEVQSQVSFSY